MLSLRSIGRRGMNEGAMLESGARKRCDPHRVASHRAPGLRSTISQAAPARYTLACQAHSDRQTHPLNTT